MKATPKQRATFKAWRRRHPDYQKNWERQRAREVRESKRRWARRNRDYFKRYRLQHRAKKRAAYLTGYALRCGRLQRPGYCSQCGVACQPQAHHENYRKALDVVWLCIPCHLARHGRQPRDGSPSVQLPMQNK